MRDIIISKIDKQETMDMIYNDGRKAIKNKKRMPHIQNPYLEGTDYYLAFDKGMKDQIAEDKSVGNVWEHQKIILQTHMVA